MQAVPGRVEYTQNGPKAIPFSPYAHNGGLVI